MHFKQILAVVSGLFLLSSCHERGQGVSDRPTEVGTAVRTPAANFPDFTHLLAQVGPSVVSIDSYYVAEPNEESFPAAENNHDEDDDLSNSGSGIILDGDGYIITNAHVVEGGNNIKVALMDRRVFMAKVIGVDTLTDLALLKIQADHLTPIKLGDTKKIQVGQWIAALGTPFGFQFSLTAGIISAVKRTIQDDSSYIPFIQVDAAINQGNSGGPLLNLSGEVIGVNSQIYTRTGGFVGIAFAIPIDIVINVADQLKATGKVERGQLGVKVDGMSYDLARAFGLHNADGVLILDVVKGHDVAGKLAVGDIILQVNNTTLTEPDELPGILNLLKPGEKITLSLWRNKKPVTVDVMLQSQDDLSDIRKDVLQLNELNSVRAKIMTAEGLDVGLARPNPQILAYYQLKNGLQIVTIGKIAESLGFALGDIIIRVGAVTVKTPQDLMTALKTQNNVPVFLLRNNQPIFIPYNQP